MSEGEIITRRRKWSPAQKSALLDEVEAENGKVAVVSWLIALQSGRC